MSSADVVVVGAGLAGLTAAIALADSGARVEVVARGHAATHWTAGGIDVAAPRGSATPAEGVAALAAPPRAPVRDPRRRGSGGAGAISRIARRGAGPDRTTATSTSRSGRSRRRSAARGRPRSCRPPRPRPSHRGRPTSGSSSAGSPGSRTSGPTTIAASLDAIRGRGAGRRRQRRDPARRRVEAVTVELPGLAGRRNLTALTSPGCSTTRLARGPAVDAVVDGAGPDRVPPGPGRPAGRVGLAEHATAFERAGRVHRRSPRSRSPLVPPSIPGLRLFAALRAALRDAAAES